MRAALIERGVSEADIISGGHRETKPIASNKTPNGHIANRRCEIVLVVPRSPK